MSLGGVVQARENEIEVGKYHKPTGQFRYTVETAVQHWDHQLQLRKEG